MGIPESLRINWANPTVVPYLKLVLDRNSLQPSTVATKLLIESYIKYILVLFAETIGTVSL